MKTDAICAYPTLPPVIPCAASSQAAVSAHGTRQPRAPAVDTRHLRGTPIAETPAASPRPPAPAAAGETPSAPPLSLPPPAFAWETVRLDADQPLGAPATRWFGALAEGDTKMLQALLRETGIGPDLVHPRCGRTALELAATAGCAARVSSLYRLGAAVAPSGEPRALRAAARAGHAEVVDLLCHSDGDVEAVIAELRREVQVTTVQWLLQRPGWGDRRLQDDVACAAIRRDDARGLQALFPAGARVPARLRDAFEPEGRYPVPPRGGAQIEEEPLQLAVARHAWAAMRVLLDCGAAAEPQLLYFGDGDPWPRVVRAAIPASLPGIAAPRTPSCP